MQTTGLKVAVLSAFAMGLTPAALHAQDAMELKVSHAFPATHYLIEEGLNVWTDELADRLGDRVAFTVYPAQQLGKAAEALQLAADGVADLVLTATSYHPSQITVSGVAELPGLFEDICAASEASMALSQDGAIFDTTDFEPNGVIAIYNASLPTYKVVTSTTPVSTLEDVAGLKLRTTGAAMDMAARALGASAVRMPSSELFQSAQRGTVDGALFLYTGMPPWDLNSVFHHATEGVSMGSTHVVLLMNREMFRALPEDVRRAFLEAGKVAARNNCAWMAENDKLIRDRMVAEDGLVVTVLDPPEIARWKERTDSVAAQWVEAIGAQGKPAQEALDAFRAELDGRADD